MKHDRLFTWIEAAVTGFFLSFPAAACLVTAFSMTPVDLWLLALYCGIGSILCGFLCSRRLDLLVLGLLALGAGYLWQNGILELTAESLLYKISRVYHDAYDWPIIRWGWRTAQEMELTLAPGIYIIGVLLSVLTAWTVCKGQSSIVACVPAALPVAACFVVTDSVPDTVHLVLFLTAAAVMMFTSTARQYDRIQGRRLAAMIAIPTFIAVGILFLSVPQQTYYHQEKAQAISDFLGGKYTLEQMLDRLAGNAVQLEQKKVDLSTLGARADNQNKVLEVTTRYSSGTLYLRSSSLDWYTGKQWLDSETPLPDLYWPQPADGEAYRIDEVVIKTQFAHEMLYLPYYTDSLDITGMTRGMVNTKKLNEYSITTVALSQWSVQFEADRRITADQQAQIAAATRLTEETKKWAIPLAKQIVGNVDDPYYQALYIAEFVKNSARYDKNTGRMPNEYEDFAQWFLEEGETGYCVHFATAGAVLLKALGIPARYVTGYMVNTRVGTPKEVLVSNAHAWVEYWLPGFGWTVLECTPPDASQETPPDQTQQAPLPEQTETTEPVTAPTLSPQNPTGPGKSQQWNMLYLLLIPLGAGAVWLQRWLRLERRKKRCTNGSPNAQALARWVEAERLSRHLSSQPPEELRQLAEKAKFSPYTLTEKELQVFTEYLQGCVAALKKKNIFVRLLHQWALNLY